MNAETKKVIEDLATELENAWSSLVDEWGKHSDYDATNDTKEIKALIARARKLKDKN